MSDKTYFQQDWLTVPQFKDWLSAGKESLNYQMGIQAVKSLCCR